MTLTSDDLDHFTDKCHDRHDRHESSILTEMFACYWSITIDFLLNNKQTDQTSPQQVCSNLVHCSTEHSSDHGKWYKMWYKSLSSDALDYFSIGLDSGVVTVWTPIHYLNHNWLISNSLVLWGCGSDFKSINFKLTSWIWFSSNLYDIALERMSQDHTDGKSTLVQVMVWCYHATSHYLR